MKTHEIVEQIEQLVKVTRGPARRSLQQALLHLSTPKHAGLTEAQVRNHTSGKLPDTTCPGLYLEAAPRLGLVWRIRERKNRVDKILTIGTYPDMGISSARSAWRDHRTGTLTIAPINANASQKRLKAVSAGIGLGKLSDKYVAFSKKHKAKKTAAADERSFRTLIDILGDLRVDELTTDLVRDALIEVAIDKPRTADIVQGSLRKAWKVGQGKDKRQLMKSLDLWIPASLPCPDPGMKFEGSKETYGLSDEELSNYALTLGISMFIEPLEDLLVFQLHTAARVSEVCKLQNDWVKDDYVELPGSETKNKLPHRFYLTPATRAIVERNRDKDKKYLFRSESGGMISTRYVQAKLAGSRVWLGIERPDGDERGNVGTHAVRRTALSWWKSQGVPLEVRQRLANHKPQGVTSRYDWGGDLWPQAREALDQWSEHINSV